MTNNARGYIVSQLRGLKPAFASRSPHFNFITVHYFWIIGATLVCGVAIYIGGKHHIAFINALLFASGANTQAGLNPIDVNDLNGFQQAMMYFFSLLSNPITMHTCVVFLRLYWFEKRFQDWVRDVRSRRPSFSKSKGKARNELSQVEQGGGVNGRNITIVPQNGKAQRITNDGILLDGEHGTTPKATGSSHGSDASTVTGEGRKNNDDSEMLEPLEKPSDKRRTEGFQAEDEELTTNGALNEKQGGPSGQCHSAITFAETVRRSDGMGLDITKFPGHMQTSDHIAILERQRNQDNEVLRIPGPRDAEKGLGPRRLQEYDQEEEDRPTSAAGLNGNESSGIRGRQPAIKIAEPTRTAKDEISDNAAAIVSTMDTLRFRKPRFFNKSQQSKVHEDQEQRGGVYAARTKTIDTIKSVLSRDKGDDMPYLSYTPTIGRNSNFVGLTLEQREELGGIEYRSLRTLALILLFYFWGFHILGVICLWPFILHNKHYSHLLESNAIGRTWWAFWTSNMAFMDVGFTLTADSMNSFNRSEWTLCILWFFVIIGNTGFPVMLRFIIWLCSKLVPRNSGIWEELMFLLDHPRRCFTLLFPSNANWWLFCILVLLNAIDLIFFVVLDLGREEIHQLPLHNRVVIGLFQAASTRTAGFSAASMSDLHPAMPVLYMIMMYISVFPIAISIRRTNVYEEQSLGVFPDKKDDADDAPALSYVGTHLRRQLSFDLWYVFLGFFLIAITEGGKIMRGDFDLFAVLFEIISAYGTVGLSMGVPNVNASLCSQFSTLGKLIIVGMQIRGRHRGLPYGLDRAVILPSEARFKKEAEEAEAERARAQEYMMSSAVSSGLQRPLSGSSGQSRSKSRERVNPNIIAQFLHPGPVVQDVPRPSRPRARSMPGHRRTRSAADIESGPSIRLFMAENQSHGYNHTNNDTNPITPLQSLDMQDKEDALEF